jgi:type IV secretory pathway TrbD component
MHEKGFTKYLIGKRFMTFGVDGVSIFQGTRLSVIKQIVDGWAPHSIGFIVWFIQLTLLFRFCFI